MAARQLRLPIGSVQSCAKCFEVWKLFLKNTNFCNNEQLKIKEFAHHFSVIFFQNLRERNFITETVFSDEAASHLSSYTNRRNFRI
jgi:hypothetical protein